jgi:tetratricopeptide (TPR) repeat protein
MMINRTPEAADAGAGSARSFAVFAVVLAAALLFTYQALWSAGFIWDDDDHFTNNPHVADPRGLLAIWTSAKAIYYPLTLTTWWALRRLFELNPLPYHLLNLAMHWAGALLFARVLQRIGLPRRAAYAAAALWALHPVQVETVAWATELKNTQSGVLFFTTILLYLRWLEDGAAGRKRWLALSLLAFAGALLSKPSTVPLPAVLVLLTAWKQRGLRLDGLKWTVPYFTLALAMAAWTIWEQKYHSNARGVEWSQSLAERMIIAGRVPWFYTQKLLWPQPLMFIYPRWEIDSTNAAQYLPGAVLALALGFVGWLAWRERATPGAASAALLVGLANLALLFPVMGFFNIYFTRFSFVADHFQYLASAAIFAGVGALLARVDRPRMPLHLAALLLVVTCLYGVQTLALSRSYRDEETLWRVALAKNADAWIGWNNLGHQLVQKGKPGEALPAFQQAVALKPDYEEALNNLGRTLNDLGRPAEAIEPLRAAIRYRENYPDAYNNLGNALAETGNVEDALRMLEAAVQSSPDVADYHENLGVVQARARLYKDAAASFEQAMKLDPARKHLEERIRMLRSMGK